MTCNQFRYELSQCLDGRLPSGRRTQVMQHVEQCEGCSTFWNELQAAQSLVLQLPRERVSEGFRAQLWERIQSGEGTPEAVFREPVPFTTKLRYAFTGAAAAAAVLLGTLLLQPDRTPKSTIQVADADGSASHDGGLRQRVHDDVPSPNATLVADPGPLGMTRRLTPDLVALEAARQIEQSYVTVRSTLTRIRMSQIDAKNGGRQVLDNANNVYICGEVLLDLSDRRRLVFGDPEVAADLRYAVSMLGQLSRLPSEQMTEVIGQALESRRLGSLSGTIGIVPMSPHEAHDVLVRITTLRPEVFPKLFLVWGTDAELRSLAFDGNAFLMEDSCGSSWVTPRSQAESGAGQWSLLRKR